MQSDGIDLVIGEPFKFGIGYSLQPDRRICAWGGMGGSAAIMPVDRRITFAYVMNKMGDSSITRALAELVKENRESLRPARHMAQNPNSRCRLHVSGSTAIPRQKTFSELNLVTFGGMYQDRLLVCDKRFR